jgi:hypothetical protein
MLVSAVPARTKLGKTAAFLPLFVPDRRTSDEVTKVTESCLPFSEK